MNTIDQSPAPATSASVAQRWLPALLFLFIGSGCAALIYEVVWFQLLQLSIGSSAVSLGVLLGIFMGGMCLGSLLLPKYIKPISIHFACMRSWNWASASSA
jgi:spermidine synthase